MASKNSSSSKSAQVVPVFAASQKQFNAYRAAKQALSAQLLQPRAAAFSAFSATNPIPGTSADQNVVGCGIGEQVSKGIATGIMAVKVLVRIKYADGQIPAGDRLPKTINGLPVDVEQVGTFRRFLTSPNPQVRIRPAQPGSSVGYQDPAGLVRMAGTFGAVVRRAGKTFILSNNHVLADENRLPPGAPIFQPGLLDGGRVPTDRIAALSQFVALQPAGVNEVDAAIAKVDNAATVSKNILTIGAPAGSTQAVLGMDVHKFGRTTGYRAGRITSIETDVRVGYEIGELLFNDQIIIQGHNNQPFSASGDSGSLILERGTNRAVGLLFAGSSTQTVANHIGKVLTALNVTLA